MPQHSFDFIGVELAKYHDVVTRFEAAKAAGDPHLRTFSRKGGYRTGEKRCNAFGLLDEEADTYKFHKKTKGRG